MNFCIRKKFCILCDIMWLHRAALGALKHLHLEMECRILLIVIFGFGFYRMLVVLLER